MTSQSTPYRGFLRRRSGVTRPEVGRLRTTTLKEDESDAEGRWPLPPSAQRRFWVSLLLWLLYQRNHGCNLQIDQQADAPIKLKEQRSFLGGQHGPHLGNVLCAQLYLLFIQSCSPFDETVCLRVRHAVVSLGI